MGLLKKLFGLEDEGTEIAENEDGNLYPVGYDETIPPDKVGIDGNFDENGLAKRVVLAIDRDPELASEEDLYVGQASGSVVFRGKVSSQEVLDRVADLASRVYGATGGVNTDEVEVTG